MSRLLALLLDGNLDLEISAPRRRFLLVPLTLIGLNFPGALFGLFAGCLEQTFEKVHFSLYN